MSQTLQLVVTPGQGLKPGLATRNTTRSTGWHCHLGGCEFRGAPVIGALKIWAEAATRKVPIQWSVNQHNAGGSLTDVTAEGLVERARPVRLGHYIPAPKRNTLSGADDFGYRCRIVGAGAADRVAEPKPAQ